MWREFAFEAMKVAADLLRRHGLAQARIGLELDYLPAADFAELAAAAAGGANSSPRRRCWRGCARSRPRTRSTSCGGSPASPTTASPRPSPRSRAGATEMDIAAALTRSVYEQGAEYFKLMIVATGERSVFPNVGPTARVLARGDVCRVEIFPMIAGYHAGVCRTAVVETAPPQAERIWANLTACKHMLLDTMKPGASSRAIYERYLAKTEELALPRISFVGHGIGLHLHEDPYLGPTADQPLEPGMVLGIEPLIYQTGFGFGMQNKDMVLVTERGCELLSDVTDTDRLIGA